VDDQELRVLVELSNVGERAGAEVVQLYLAPVAVESALEPKRLVGFGRVELAPGQRKGLMLRLSTRELARYDAATGSMRRPTGVFRLWAGPSSVDLPLSADLELS
jgi:beta-glucosidase